MNALSTEEKKETKEKQIQRPRETRDRDTRESKGDWRKWNRGTQGQRCRENSVLKPRCWYYFSGLMMVWKL